MDLLHLCDVLLAGQHAVEHGTHFVVHGSEALAHDRPINGRQPVAEAAEHTTQLLRRSLAFLEVGQEPFGKQFLLGYIVRGIAFFRRQVGICLPAEAPLEMRIVPAFYLRSRPAFQRQVVIDYFLRRVAGHGHAFQVPHEKVGGFVGERGQVSSALEQRDDRLVVTDELYLPACAWACLLLLELIKSVDHLDGLVVKDDKAAAIAMTVIGDAFYPGFIQIYRRPLGGCFEF